MDTKDARKALSAIREAIDLAIDSVRHAHPGLKISLDRCTFGHDGSFTFKLNGTLPGGKSKDETAYESLRAALAIPEATYVPDPAKATATSPAWKRGPDKPGIVLPPLGTAFSHNGVRYVVKGATRTKVIAERLDGKSFVWKPEAVAKLSQVGVAS